MSIPIYEINGQLVEDTAFIATACNPRYSVVVEACAGSGKTWLLVARILRLLLAGAEPEELLAITFTRKVAQEMRTRLLLLLKELALCSDNRAYFLLKERGLITETLEQILPLARVLYERILSGQQNLSIDTFHSWFSRLLEIAPLKSSVPYDYILIEKNNALINEAYYRFMCALLLPEHEEIKNSLMILYNIIGDTNTKKLLNAFIDKRAEWYVITKSSKFSQNIPLEWLRVLCETDMVQDPRNEVWSNKALQVKIYTIISLLEQGTFVNKNRAMTIKKIITGKASIENFTILTAQFYNFDGKLYKNLKTKNLRTALVKYFRCTEEIAITAFDNVFKDVAENLQYLQRRSTESIVFKLNRALFNAGDFYLKIYQDIKTEQKVFDFIDLEWNCYQLLINENNAAYLHHRLDIYYKHILLDEFQDTNSLQWSIMRAWLRAYNTNNIKQPTIFIVGDPKQSIYRFRRADPRIFIAASNMLKNNGAYILRTNCTRRNASAIIDLLNSSFFSYNTLFSLHSTSCSQIGAVWRLPLVGKTLDIVDALTTSNHTLTKCLKMRNPLIEARKEEDDNVYRYNEGYLVAQAILQARQEIVVYDDKYIKRSMKWSDIILLVKTRRHLDTYENALRAAGIPCISDKRSGLLESLEITDLIALLTFLITPNDKLTLIHVLKSPIIGASDIDLIKLAQHKKQNWWQCIQSLKHNSNVSDIMLRAKYLLTRWVKLAPYYSVQSLLDLILYEGDLIARYAQTVSPTARMQVLENINTFIALALNVDIKPYPSLSNFINNLHDLYGDVNINISDKAIVDTVEDAVRILTIHSVKGLEAPVIVVLDANHTNLINDSLGILCDWYPNDDSPKHFSAFCGKNERGVTRESWFIIEEKLNVQENWNLLYVAITRAKQLLIVSGIADFHHTSTNGIQENSWYDRLFSKNFNIKNINLGKNYYSNSSIQVTRPEFVLPMFYPKPLSLLTDKFSSFSHSSFIDEGIALHALLERITYAHVWPLVLPSAIIVAQWLRCSNIIAKTISIKATKILSQPLLERFFNPKYYHSAHNEMEIVVADKILRCDRVVIFDNEIWILDYKRSVINNKFRVIYRAQLARYCSAALSIFYNKTIRSALITADGQLVEEFIE